MGGGGYAASNDTTTNETAYSDTVAAETAVANNSAAEFHQRHSGAAETLVKKWDDASANSDGGDGGDEGRRIFVFLICKFQYEIKVSIIIIFLQPIAVQYPSLDCQSKRVTLRLRQLCSCIPK